MGRILKAIAKLFGIRNIVTLILTFSFVMFVSSGKIDISIFSSIAIAAINKALNSED